MLRLEAETRPFAVRKPAFALQGAIEEVARIELQAGLGRGDVHGSTALGIGQPRGEFQPGALSIQYPVVVVAGPLFQLIVVLIDARADRRRLPKVERRA